MPTSLRCVFFHYAKIHVFPQKKTSSPQASEHLQAFIKFSRILLRYSTTFPVSHHHVSSFSKPHRRSPTGLIPFFAPPSCHSNNYTWWCVAYGCSVCWIPQSWQEVEKRSLRFEQGSISSILTEVSKRHRNRPKFSEMDSESCFTLLPSYSLS